MVPGDAFVVPDADSATLALAASQISSCGKKDDAICGFDPAAGRKLWRTPIPESGHLAVPIGSIAVADGRVYIKSFVGKNVKSNTLGQELVVFDGRTGRVLSRNPVAGDEAFIFGPVVDGIVVTGVATDDLYAKRPDIQSPRTLP